MKIIFTAPKAIKLLNAPVFMLLKKDNLSNIFFIREVLKFKKISNTILILKNGKLAVGYLSIQDEFAIIEMQSRDSSKHAKKFINYFTTNAPALSKLVVVFRRIINFWFSIVHLLKLRNDVT